MIFSFPLQALTLRTSAASLFLTIRGLCRPSPPAHEAGGSLQLTDMRGGPSVIPSHPPSPPPSPPSARGSEFEFFRWLHDTFETRPLYAVPVLFLLGITTVIGFSLDSIGITSDLTGSVGATSIAFIAPPVMYFRIKRATAPPALVGLSVFVFIFGLFILISGVTFAALYDV